jgi:hypothetical protein
VVRNGDIVVSSGQSVSRDSLELDVAGSGIDGIPLRLNGSDAAEAGSVGAWPLSGVWIGGVTAASCPPDIARYSFSNRLHRARSSTIGPESGTRSHHHPRPVMSSSATAAIRFPESSTVIDMNLSSASVT